MVPIKMSKQKTLSGEIKGKKINPEKKNRKYTKKKTVKLKRAARLNLPYNMMAVESIA